ncbi:uncharacterized protein LOC124356912 isoform X2 [Homalodisca vitripennis]|uniref:uncharacterized protein LOC124356912 isoform X2 n=1 Tax=Homalodisca vitripennis TaxID=197043 RepID=UPI001EEC2C5C|nr:uncharacterized protein LOC124356912 isoform X2 [Homalodisca vitripennis]
MMVLEGDIEVEVDLVAEVGLVEDLIEMAKKVDIEVEEEAGVEVGLMISVQVEGDLILKTESLEEVERVVVDLEVEEEERVDLAEVEVEKVDLVVEEDEIMDLEGEEVVLVVEEEVLTHRENLEAGPPGEDLVEVVEEEAATVEEVVDPLGVTTVLTITMEALVVPETHRDSEVVHQLDEEVVQPTEVEVVS